MSRHGIPSQLLSDRGQAFLSKLMGEACEVLGVRKVNTTSYHPQTDIHIVKGGGLPCQLQDLTGSYSSLLPLILVNKLPNDIFKMETWELEVILKDLVLEVKAREDICLCYQHGLVERFNRTLTNMLAKRVDRDGTDWDLHLPYTLECVRLALLLFMWTLLWVSGRSM